MRRPTGELYTPENIEVQELVQEVLENLPQHIINSENVTGYVFLAIEMNTGWCKGYDRLEMNPGKHELNKYIGWWITETLGKTAGDVHGTGPPLMSILIKTGY